MSLSGGSEEEGPGKHDIWRGVSSTSSCGSMGSDRSMDEPPYFCMEPGPSHTKQENQDLTSAVGKILDHLTRLDNVQLNIAVTGESGSGKSTFINAFRGLGHEEYDSAPTGVVETTLEPEAYPHPKYPNVTLWDLPSIGTPTFKADQYLKDVQFKRYDFFIIVASDRFKECHVQLAREIQKMKKNFYFLRNKIDANIEAEWRSKPRTFNKEKTLEDIRQNCIKGLEKIDVTADVFLISCFDLGHYDFNRLRDAIDKESRHVLLLALPNIAMDIVHKKKTALKADIWKVALLSGIVAAVPVPGLSFAVDVDILLKEIKKYCKVFGLDDESLQKLAKISCVSVKELKDEMKYTQHISIIGSTTAVGMSFVTTLYLLHKYLEEMATDACNVLMKAIEHRSPDVTRSSPGLRK